MPSAKTKTDRHVVITVHGTFDNADSPVGHRWWQTGSAFVASLRRELAARGYTNVDVLPWQWAGTNSEADRDAHAHYFAVRLQQKDYWREAPLAIIAHSHGGNVVLQALAEGRVRQKLGGIVTLGTPFFHRGLKTVPLINAALAIALAILLLTTFGILALGLIFEALTKGSFIESLTKEPLEIIVTLMAPIFMGLMLGFRGSYYFLAGWLAEGRIRSTIADGQWLAVYSPKDEAIRLLEAAQNLGPIIITKESATRSIHAVCGLVGLITASLVFVAAFLHFYGSPVDVAQSENFKVRNFPLLLLPIIPAVVTYTTFLSIIAPGISQMGGASAWSYFVSRAIRQSIVDAFFGNDYDYRLLGVAKTPPFGVTATILASDLPSPTQSAFSAAEAAYSELTKSEMVGLGDPRQFWSQISHAAHHNAYMSDAHVMTAVADHLAAQWDKLHQTSSERTLPDSALLASQISPDDG